MKKNFQIIFQKDTRKIKKYIDINSLINQKYTNNSITNYYKKTKYLLYRLHGTKQGFMHIGLSFDGKYSKNRGYEYNQAKQINSYINETNAQKVLELGCGQGANLLFLSKLNKSVKFYGIDLYPSIDKDQKNVTLIKNDYHNLKTFKNSSLDIIYAVETICYSTTKEELFKEVKRVLKKDGLFIIFDGYSSKKEDNLNKTERLYKNLTESGFSMNNFEYIRNVDKYLNSLAFKVIKRQNLKKNVLPQMIDVRNRIEKWMKMGFLFKLFLKLLPREVSGSMVPVYFMKHSIESGLSVYYLHILKK